MKKWWNRLVAKFLPTLAPPGPPPPETILTLQVIRAGIFNSAKYVSIDDLILYLNHQSLTRLRGEEAREFVQHLISELENAKKA